MRRETRRLHSIQGCKESDTTERLTLQRDSQTIFTNKLVHELKPLEGQGGWVGIRASECCCLEVVTGERTLLGWSREENMLLWREKRSCSRKTQSPRTFCFSRKWSQFTGPSDDCIPKADGFPKWNELLLSFQSQDFRERETQGREVCWGWGLLMCSRPVMSDSGPRHGLQLARPPSPSPSPEVCPRSCPLSQWCYPTISSSDTLFPSALNLSQHQGLFQWVSCSRQMAQVLELTHKYLVKARGWWIPASHH